MVEGVQVVAVASVGREELLGRHQQRRGGRFDLPVEHPRGILAVSLGVAPGAHVEEDAAASFLLPSGMGELQAELRLADPGGADHDGERPRQQPAAEGPVEFDNSRGKARFVAHGDSSAGWTFPLLNMETVYQLRTRSPLFAATVSNPWRRERQCPRR